MQFRIVYHPSHSETQKTRICDALTRLLHLLKMGSLVDQNSKLMLRGFGLVAQQYHQGYQFGTFLFLSAAVRLGCDIFITWSSPAVKYILCRRDSENLYANGAQLGEQPFQFNGPDVHKEKLNGLLLLFVNYSNLQPCNFDVKINLT